MDRNEKEFPAHEAHPKGNVARPGEAPDEREVLEVDPVRPAGQGRSAPKFGAAGSGGAELEGPPGIN